MTKLKIELKLPGTAEDLTEEASGIMFWLCDLVLKCKMEGLGISAWIDDIPLDLQLINFGNPGKKPS